MSELSEDRPYSMAVSEAVVIGDEHTVHGSIPAESDLSLTRSLKDNLASCLSCLEGSNVLESGGSAEISFDGIGVVVNLRNEVSAAIYDNGDCAGEPDRRDSLQGFTELFNARAIVVLNQEGRTGFIMQGQLEDKKGAPHYVVGFDMDSDEIIGVNAPKKGDDKAQDTSHIRLKPIESVAAPVKLEFEIHF